MYLEYENMYIFLIDTVKAVKSWSNQSALR